MMNFDWSSRKRIDGRGDAGPVDFPQAGEAVAPERALIRLRESRAFESPPVSCKILNIWYMPRKSLYVVYEVGFRAAPAAILTLQFLGDRGAAGLDRIDRGPMLLLEAWNAVAWRFPADPKRDDFARLTQLSAVSDIVSAASHGKSASSVTRWQLLSYLPGERCALGYGGSNGSLAIVGKLQKNAVETHRRLTHLWQSRDRGFGMAEPLAADDTLGARWERFVPGERLDKIEGLDRTRDCIRQAMQGLVGLHRSKLERLPERGAEEVHRRTTGKVADRIRKAVPALEARTDAFCEKLTRAMGNLPERRPTTIHGDFHTANILFDSTRPCFIDLDELAHGDPAYDLALFGTRLLLSGLYRPADQSRFAAHAAALPQIYAEAGGEPIPEAVYAWYVSALLVGRQIKTCIRHCAPHLEETSYTLMQWAHATLDRGTFDAGIVIG
jgi:Phosphotransferase enzyme family